MKAARFLFLIAFAGSLHAAFQTDHPSVRTRSMGGAVAAASQGSADLFSNPAALARVSATELSLMYGKPYAGLPGVDLAQGAATAAWPSRFGTLGVGLDGFRAAGAKEERTFAVSYGAAVGRVRAGVTAKQLYQRYLVGGDGAQNDPIFRGGTSRSAYDFDAGLTADLGGPLKAGVTVRNLRKADLGLVGKDAVHREVQGGLALDVSAWGLSAAGDLAFRQSRFGEKSNVIPFFGLEKALYERVLFLRAGGNRDEFSGGLGFRKACLGIDYGFALSRTLSNDNAGTHQVQLTYRFQGQ